MPSSLSQNSFTGGEISPRATGRTDLARYQTSLATCRNLLIHVTGGVFNRPGTQYVCELKDSTKRGRLIPFQFSTTQGYCLVFEDGFLRVVKDGGQVLFTSGPNIGDPFEAVSPYSEAQLPNVKYTRLGDVMTLVHQQVIQQQLSRTAHDAWTFTNFASVEGPFQEINADKAKVIQASAVTGSVTLTATGHTPFTAVQVGMLFYLEQKDFGVPWEVAKAVVSNDIRRSEGRYYEAQNAATTGTLRPTDESGDVESDGAVNWLYKHSGYGILKITGFTDSTHVTATVLKELPATTVSATTYKWALGAWGGEQGYPGAVTYFKQRQAFGGAPGNPQRLDLSAINAFTMFGRSTPLSDDDAVTMRLVSNEINAVLHLIGLGKMIVFTAGGKFIVPDPDQDSQDITPTQRSARDDAGIGSSFVRPVVVKDAVVYVVDKGQSVEDVAYQFASNAFSGSELSVLSSHLLEGHEIIAQAYQHTPFRTIWLVRDDGILIALAYLREHQVSGWTWQDTEGLFEDVCVVSEPPEDRVYFIVNRTINGVTKRCVERLHSRLYTDIKDAIFLDSSLTYDGRNTSAITMTLSSSGATWVYDSGEVFTLLASASYFIAGHVDDEIHFKEFTVGQDEYGKPIEVLTGRVLRAKITAVSDNQHATVTLNRDVPPTLRATTRIEWGHAKQLFAGLEHLEAEDVGVFADGFVVANPNNTAYDVITVASGAVTLDRCYVVVHVGLSYNSDFETLDMNDFGQETIRDKQKIVNKVTLLVESSRGIFAGDSFEDDHLLEYPQRNVENYDEPVELLTGQAKIHIQSTWSRGGRVCARQKDPLPLTILAAIPTVELGGSA